MKDGFNENSAPMQSGLRQGSHDLSKALPILFVCLGIILRLVQYLYNRSLWLDESWLALNIINRSFKTLLQPLDFNQGTPVGFLMIERAALELLGQSEYALRLFPFICGILSIFLFYKLAKQYLQGKAVLIALGLFAISQPLIYYSSEVKQYSNDVIVTLLLFVGVNYIRSHKPTVAKILLMGLAGAAAVWLSHPALFVLTGITVCLMLSALRRGDFQPIKSYLPAFILWLLGFAGCYLVSLRYLAGNHALLDYWQGSFMPLPPRSIEDLKWFYINFFETFKFPGGWFHVPGLAALALIVGSLSMWKEKKDELLMLTAPIAIVLIASGFHKYPYSERLLLFIAPLLLLLVATGVEFIRYTTRADNRTIGITLMVLLFLDLAMTSGYHLIKPITPDDIKPVLEYVTNHKHNDDKLYIYYKAQYSFKYYQKKYAVKDDDYLIGISAKGEWDKYKPDLERLSGFERIWLIFSHVNTDSGVNEELFILHCLDGMGQRLDSIKANGASAYLYRLTQ